MIDFKGRRLDWGNAALLARFTIALTNNFKISIMIQFLANIEIINFLFNSSIFYWKSHEKKILKISK